MLPNERTSTSENSNATSPNPFASPHIPSSPCAIPEPGGASPATLPDDDDDDDGSDDHDESDGLKKNADGLGGAYKIGNATVPSDGPPVNEKDRYRYNIFFTIKRKPLDII